MSKLLWDEPRGYRRAVNREQFSADYKQSLGYATFCFIAFCGLRLVAGINPGPDQHPPAWNVFLPASAVLGVLIAFGLPRVFMLLATATVVISDLGINHNVMWGRGWRINHWKWAQISSCEFRKCTKAEQTYRTLQINDTSRRILETVAISPKADEDNIREILIANGCQVLGCSE